MLCKQNVSLEVEVSREKKGDKHIHQACAHIHGHVHTYMDIYRTYVDIYIACHQLTEFKDTQ